MRSIIPDHLTRNWAGITCILSLQGWHRTPAANQDHWPGKCTALMVKTEEVGARPQLFPVTDQGSILI